MRIAITSGEPAGIGPDLVVQMAQQARSEELVVLASPELLKQRAEKLQLPLQLRAYDPSQAPSSTAPGELCILPVSLPHSVQAGTLDASNSHYVLHLLDRAIDGCVDGHFDAMVTAPVHKGVINEAGIPFSGHTEYLQERTHTEQVVMMLASESMRVALVTTHLPLANVASAITQERLALVSQVLYHDLQRHFGIDDPKILVCGLNPHAGEGGHMGREEVDLISPFFAQRRQQGQQFIGPLPADTLFTEKYLRDADAVLAMYHDQGLPVLKYQGFGRSVNITLGLPIVRTSVDHGTALDLAGSGQADGGSLEAAIQQAIVMASARR